MGVIKIKLIETKNVVPISQDGGLALFCSIRVDDQPFAVTAMYKIPAPVPLTYNHDAPFNISSPDGKHFLEIGLYDGAWDRPVGKKVLPLDKVIEGTAFNGDLDVDMNGKKTGEVKVSVEYDGPKPTPPAAPVAPIPMTPAIPIQTAPIAAAAVAVPVAVVANEKGAGLVTTPSLSIEDHVKAILEWGNKEEKAYAVSTIITHLISKISL
mmetsp:Transcript_203/g.408  ORF Transcript_203/g.408 Transcript_203/m.408 type:complete len:210 (-) Transcript_203:424-1053(-)|eukprot:CAMPEP_0184655848 /NCGR_PEP_ID=MMETSP0308-20130426/14619_1 /TAXON_ID=38269 /ORGANISM="Gloeochaete witrockiana, Strain SAG 46.84" /LENGTH=209 /DNA_ID=CAMNT_0027092629 /DNA_START=132 /DNA_END=761 /DNA_ORIENTATION=+